MIYQIKNPRDTIILGITDTDTDTIGISITTSIMETQNRALVSL
jgi:hypothetical protein